MNIEWNQTYTYQFKIRHRDYTALYILTIVSISLSILKHS